MYNLCMSISLPSRTANGLLMDMVHEVAMRKNLGKNEEKRLLAAAAHAYYEKQIPLNEVEQWLLLAATTGRFSVR